MNHKLGGGAIESLMNLKTLRSFNNPGLQAGEYSLRETRALAQLFKIIFLRQFILFYLKFFL